MSNWPAAAAQPMSGGMAPTTAPTQVFATLTTLSGVYTAAYSPMFAAPSAAVVPFACARYHDFHRAVTIKSERTRQVIHKTAENIRVQLQGAGPPHLEGQNGNTPDSHDPSKHQRMSSRQQAQWERSSLCSLHQRVIRYLVHLIQGVGSRCTSKGS